MVTVLVGIAVAVWLALGVKTWAFGLTDLADANPDRSAVYVYFLVGMFWPITYAILALILIFGVNSQSLDSSIGKILKAWRRK